MSDEQTPNSPGTTPESEESVSGEGGPTMTQGGAMPGGSETEGSKAPPPEAGAEPSIEEQAENLRDRVERSP